MINEWIKNEDSNLELLPFCHTTRWETFEKILTHGALLKQYSRFPNPKIDGVSDKELVYLFYGLPFYIYETGNGENINIETTDDLPIGLIFKPSTVCQFSSCYPFDTGAFFSDKYKNILRCSFNELENYYRLPLIDGVEIRKLTHRYYSENENYCLGDVIVSLKNAADTKEEKLIRLLTYSADSPLDLRVRAFEIHSINNLSLKDNLLAVVLPKSRSLKFTNIVEQVETDYPSAGIVMYRDFVKGNHETFRTLIMQTTMDYYEDNYPEFLQKKNNMKYRILGYTNPLYSIPAPLITLILKENRVWAVFSDGTFSPLNREEPNFEDLNSFIKEKNEKYIEEGKYSYLTITKKIITGSTLEILPYILKDYRLTKDKELKKDLALFIQDDLDSLEVDISYDDEIIHWILNFVEEVVTNRKHKKGRKNFKKDSRHIENAIRASKHIQAVDISKIETNKEYIINNLFEGKLTKIAYEIQNLLAYQKETSSPKHIVKTLCDLASKSLEIYKPGFAKQMILYSKLLSVNDSVIDTQYAEILKYEGKLDEAKKIYQQVQENYPDNVYAKNGYAEILKAEGNLAEAKKIYEQIQEKYPNDVVARCGYAEILKAEGNIVEAKKIYEQIQEKYPNNVVAKNGYAEILKAEGNLVEAKKIYKEVYKRCPTDKYSLHGILTICLMENNLKEYLNMSYIPRESVTEDDYYFEHSYIVYLIKQKDYESSRLLLDKGICECPFPKTLILYKRTLTYLNLLEKRYECLLAEIEESENMYFTPIDNVFHTHYYAETHQMQNASEKLELVDMCEQPLIKICSKQLKSVFFIENSSYETQIQQLYDAEINALLAA
ncbi:MAG: tetratricopeptide repeat protein [Candidatus Cloacimonadales bacterium]|nr:tetratricopeptide repeat protein [Candidatus Cloacimonadales bacterium]